MKFFDKIGKFIFRGDPGKFVPKKNSPENFKKNDFPAEIQHFLSEIENKNLTKKEKILLARICLDPAGNVVPCDAVASDAGVLRDNLSGKKNPKNEFRENFRAGNSFSINLTKSQAAQKNCSLKNFLENENKNCHFFFRNRKKFGIVSWNEQKNNWTFADGSAAFLLSGENFVSNIEKNSEQKEKMEKISALVFDFLGMRKDFQNVKFEKIWNNSQKKYWNILEISAEKIGGKKTAKIKLNLNSSWDRIRAQIEIQIVKIIDSDFAKNFEIIKKKRIFYRAKLTAPIGKNGIRIPIIFYSKKPIPDFPNEIFDPQKPVFFLPHDNENFSATVALENIENVNFAAMIETGEFRNLPDENWSPGGGPDANRIYSNYKKKYPEFAPVQNLIFNSFSLNSTIIFQENNFPMLIALHNNSDGNEYDLNYYNSKNGNAKNFPAKKKISGLENLDKDNFVLICGNIKYENLNESTKGQKILKFINFLKTENVNVAYTIATGTPEASDNSLGSFFAEEYLDDLFYVNIEADEKTGLATQNFMAQKIFEYLQNSENQKFSTIIKKENTAAK